ncbi:MAG: methylenetetrahydrofolate reductase [Aestuariivirgaceae bacterium]
MEQVAPGSFETLTEHDLVKSFMSDFSVETTPGAADKIADFRQILRPGTTVYITLLPGSDYRETVGVAKRLRDEGFEPTPHFAARSIASPLELEDYLARLKGEADVEHVLVIAGAPATAIGPYSDSMQLLETGLFDKHGIKQIGVAGHPEGSPDMSDEAIRQALEWKNGFAERSDADLHIITQFCFEAAPIIAWDRQLRAAGNSLPIHIGIPGIAKVKTLLNYAMTCGVGNSIQFIKKQAGNVSRLLRTQAPDKLIRELATYSAENPHCGINRVHVYPLGGLKKSAQWSYAVSDGQFSFKQDGFDVNIPLD